MFHSDNVYRIPHMRVRGRVCFSNLSSNTAFRGFGGPQGMLVVEHWIDRIASEVGRRPEEIRVRLVNPLLLCPSLRYILRTQICSHMYRPANANLFMERCSGAIVVVVER